LTLIKTDCEILVVQSQNN